MYITSSCKISFPASERTHSVQITKTNLLMFSMEVIGINCENRMKCIKCTLGKTQSFVVFGHSTCTLGFKNQQIRVQHA